MPKYAIKEGTPLPSARQFLEYLNDWFYRDLSAESHLSGYGLMRRGGVLLAPDKHENREEMLRKYKSDQVSITITLLLALASEIEAHFLFGLAERIKYVWCILNAYSIAARELYDRRYSALLSAQP